MVVSLKDLVGEKLLQHDQSSEISTNELNGKSIAFYFSAYWCPPCLEFTPKLVEAYKQIDDEIKTKLEIIFLSFDKDQEDFNEYFNKMPWKALPFVDRDHPKLLGDRFNLDDLPSLIVLSSSLELITKFGIPEVLIAPKQALQKWSEGKSLFWTREPLENEYVWMGVTCTSCFMNPLVGSRHGSQNKNYPMTLCKECLAKTKYEYPLIEYFIPTEQYSLEQLLSTIPYLLEPKTNKEIPTKIIEKTDLKSVAFYFSAQWCPSSEFFTPLLAEFYKEIQEKSHHFEILFFSCDKDEESFNTYRSKMPWFAVPFNCNNILTEYFRVFNIPSMIVVSSDGQILSRRGFEGVQQHGRKALEIWSQGKKLTRPSPEQYKWLHVACDVCGVNPVVGERYSCLTCGNYDLCSTCQNKGHEHELQLQPLPNEDD
ncbi:hypothetical protein I4U23_006088 [Adineta vaga]|nr:hypothetical protein I4U23_006088 [Adineta vaga]